jgi:uncharacterized protein (TIGR02145 family)
MKPFHYFTVLIITLLLLQSCGEKKGSKTVSIGKQEWMTEDLHVRTYQNGYSIFFCRNKEDWWKATSQEIGACCYIQYDSIKGKESGMLYNWHAVNDSRGLAPKGYKVPNVKDWKQLISFAGGTYVAGKHLKANGGSWFLDKGYVCEDKFGFKAKPSMLVTGTDANWGRNGRWWTSDAVTNGYFAKFVSMRSSSNECNIVSEIFKSEGLTVRCIKK